MALRPLTKLFLGGAAGAYVGARRVRRIEESRSSSVHVRGDDAAASESSVYWVIVWLIMMPLGLLWTYLTWAVAPLATMGIVFCTTATVIMVLGLRAVRADRQ